MKYLLQLFIIALVLLSFSQNSESKYLFWKPDIKLRWSDFHGHVKSEDDASASASYIGFLHLIKKCAHPDSVILDTRAFFNKSRSWVKVPSVNPSLLSHEQLHFDLAELYARKFRKAIQGINMNAKTITRMVDSTFKYYASKDDSIHFLYDVETNHGLDRTSQYRWDENVKNDLLLLGNYESPSLKIYLTPGK